MRLNTREKIAMAKAASGAIRSARRLLGLGNMVRVRRGRVNWILDLREGIDFSIYLLGGFERGTLKLYERILAHKKSQVVFDIGANIGAHTLPLARLVAPSGGQVHAFEPTVYAIDKMRKNLALNPEIAGSVIVTQAMLTGQRGLQPDKEIYSSWPLVKDKRLHAVHRGKLKNTTGAKAVMLDDYVDQSGLERVDLVKMDVDGHEPEVMAGAWETFKRFRPLLIMEWSPCLFTERPNVMENILDRLFGMGYYLNDGDTGREIRNGLSALRSLTPGGGSMNVLLMPQGNRLPKKF